MLQIIYLYGKGRFHAKEHKKQRLKEKKRFMKGLNDYYYCFIEYNTFSLVCQAGTA